MKRLLLAPLLLLSTVLSSCTNSAKGEAIYLKCDIKGDYFPSEITINPGKEFGTISWKGSSGNEVSAKAQQFISSDSYKLKIVEVGMLSNTKTYSISRTDGSITREIFSTENRDILPTLYDSGKCKKIKRAKTLF